MVFILVRPWLDLRRSRLSLAQTFRFLSAPDVEYMDYPVTHWKGKNSALFESIDCVAQNNVLTNVIGAGFGLYASLRPVVLHNTMWNVAQQMQTPILVNGVQVRL